MKRILPILLLLAPLLPAQTWKTVVPENGTATLPATAASPITYRYGGLATATVPAKWCDSVTVTATTSVVAANGGTCKVNGVVTSDPDPNVVKELDVQEQAASFVVQTVINGTKGSVTVPALPVVVPPPPPPPPPPPTGPQTSATVPAPDSASRIYWCDINQPNFTCIPARTDGK